VEADEKGEGREKAAALRYSQTTLICVPNHTLLGSGNRSEMRDVGLLSCMFTRNG